MRPGEEKMGDGKGSETLVEGDSIWLEVHRGEIGDDNSVLRLFRGDSRNSGGLGGSIGVGGPMLLKSGN